MMLQQPPNATSTSALAPQTTWNPMQVPSHTFTSQHSFPSSVILSSMGIYSLLYLLALQILPHFILIMFLFLQALLRTLFLFINLPQTTMALRNLTHMVLLWRIFPLKERSLGAIDSDPLYITIATSRIYPPCSHLFTLAPTSWASWPWSYI